MEDNTGLRHAYHDMATGIQQGLPPVPVLL